MRLRIFCFLIGASFIAPVSAITWVESICGQIRGIDPQQRRVQIDDRIFYIQPQDMGQLAPFLVGHLGHRICFSTSEQDTKSYINLRSLTLDKM